MPTTPPRLLTGLELWMAGTEAELTDLYDALRASGMFTVLDRSELHRVEPERYRQYLRLHRRATTAPRSSAQAESDGGGVLAVATAGRGGER